MVNILGKLSVINWARCSKVKSEVPWLLFGNFRGRRHLNNNNNNSSNNSNNKNTNNKNDQSVTAMIGIHLDPDWANAYNSTQNKITQKTHNFLSFSESSLITNVCKNLVFPSFFKFSSFFWAEFDNECLLQYSKRYEHFD